jgi:hypothetical protein
MLQPDRFELRQMDHVMLQGIGRVALVDVERAAGGGESPVP